MAERENIRNVKIRVESDQGDSEPLTERIVDILEEAGYEVIEWTKPFPVRADPTRERVFLGAVPSKERGD